MVFLKEEDFNYSIPFLFTQLLLWPRQPLGGILEEFGWFGGMLEEFVREKYCSGGKKKRIKPNLRARERDKLFLYKAHNSMCAHSCLRHATNPTRNNQFSTQP